MSGGIKSIFDAKDMLKNILLFINAAESGENEEMASKGRMLLLELRVQIGCVWSDNADLQAFDSTFKVCGWDGQGFRWCRSVEESINGRIVLRIDFVEFDDDDNKTWHTI